MDQAILEYAEDNDLLIMDGYDDCIIGIVQRCGQEEVVCYSMTKLVERHMKDGMTEQEAWEFIQFNQSGAYVGTGTPCFLIDEL